MARVELTVQSLNQTNQLELTKKLVCPYLSLMAASDRMFNLVKIRRLAEKAISNRDEQASPKKEILQP